MILIMLLEIPQPQRPVAEERIDVGHQRPVFVLDLRPTIPRDTRAVLMGLASQP